MKIYSLTGSFESEFDGGLNLNGGEITNTQALILNGNGYVYVTQSLFTVPLLSTDEAELFGPGYGNIYYDTGSEDYKAYSSRGAWETILLSGDPSSQKTLVSYATASITASAYNLVVISSSADIALPSSPSAGDWIKISNRSSATASLNPDGNKIMGETGSFTIDNANAGFEVVYKDATHGWVLVGVEGTTI